MQRPSLEKRGRQRCCRNTFAIEKREAKPCMTGHDRSKKWRADLTSAAL